MLLVRHRSITRSPFRLDESIRIDPRTARSASVLLGGVVNSLMSLIIAKRGAFWHRALSTVIKNLSTSCRPQNEVCGISGNSLSQDGQAVTLRGRTRTVSLDLISSTTFDFSCPFTCSLTCSLSEGTSSLSRAPSSVFNLTGIDLRSYRSPFDHIIPFPTPSVPSHSSSPGSIANSSRVGASCQARR